MLQFTVFSLLFLSCMAREPLKDVVLGEWNKLPWFGIGGQIVVNVTAESNPRVIVELSALSDDSRSRSPGQMNPAFFLRADTKETTVNFEVDGKEISSVSDSIWLLPNTTTTLLLQFQGQQILFELDSAEKETSSCVLEYPNLWESNMHPWWDAIKEIKYIRAYGENFTVNEINSHVLVI